MVMQAELARQASRHPMGVAMGFGSAAILGTALSLGFVHAMRGEVATSLTLRGGEGVVTNIFVMPPNECHGGYDTQINGASADVNKTIHGISFGFSSSETYNGSITNQVCNTGVTAGEREIDEDAHKITITIPASALNTVVYETNPVASNFTRQDGLLYAPSANAINTINSLPTGVKIKGNDDVQSHLRGWSLMAAFATSTEACGNEAWRYLRPLYAGQIAKQEAETANSFINDPTKPKYNPSSDVIVVLPPTIAFKNQYSAMYNGMKDKLAGKGVTVKLGQPNDTNGDGKVCKPSKAMTIKGAQ